MLLGTVGAAVVWMLRSGIPESPRWLAARGRMQEAEQILDDIERGVAAEQGPATLGRKPVMGLEQADIDSPRPTLLTARGINVTKGLQYAFLIAIAQPFGPVHPGRKYDVVCLSRLSGRAFPHANPGTSHWLRLLLESPGGCPCRGVALEQLNDEYIEKPVRTPQNSRA